MNKSGFLYNKDLYHTTAALTVFARSLAMRPQKTRSPIEKRRERDERRLARRPLPDPPEHECDDFYCHDTVSRHSEDNEIDSVEEGFMSGYLSA